MTSLFSFLRNLGEPETAASPNPESAGSPGPGPGALPVAATGAPSFGPPAQADLLVAIRTELIGLLPPPASGLPAPGVSITSVDERPVGLGSFLGTQRISDFELALKGGRLRVGVRFQLWGSDPADVDNAIDALHTALLAARPDLRAKGFLRVDATGSSLANPVDSLSAWRKTTDYLLLYEYRYIDSDAAQSLIARIPIHTDPETADSPERETAVVTDAMVRWDQETAPPLVIRGRGAVTALNALIFVPGAAPSAPVVLRRTFAGAAGPPDELPDVGAFVTAVADRAAPNRHAQVTFATFGDFLAAFTTSGDNIILGDWDADTVPDAYTPGALRFSQPIPLGTSTDRLELIYAPGATSPQLDQVAVIYVQAAG